MRLVRLSVRLRLKLRVRPGRKARVLPVVLGDLLQRRCAELPHELETDLVAASRKESAGVSGGRKWSEVGSRLSA